MHTSLIFAVFLGLVGCANAGNNGCPTGWKKLGGKCYLNVSEKKIPAAAQNYCKSKGGFLAEPKSEAENKFITELSSTRTRRYIGFTDTKYEGVFVGTTSGKPVCYTNWYKPTNEPNNQHNEDCVEIDFRTRYSWNDMPCAGYPQPFVCQKTACPENWEFFGDKCYFVSSEKTTWPVAEQSCRCKGGYLVEPRTAALNTFLSSLTKDWVWIGLSDRTTEGSYQWESDKSKLGSFRPWDSRQPDNYKNNEDCIHSNHAGRQGKWNDRPCTNKFVYACQISA